MAILAALYPGVWGLAQLGTGALSDQLGRKPFIVGGMSVQALGIFLIIVTDGFWPWALGAVILGLGTAMVYPTLLAAIGDVAHPAWRASSVGVYRLWRDGGYAIGALLTGLVADLSGPRWAIGVGGLLTLASGVIVAAVMAETLGATRLAVLPAFGAAVDLVDFTSRGRFHECVGSRATADIDCRAAGIGARSTALASGDPVAYQQRSRKSQS